MYDPVCNENVDMNDMKKCLSRGVGGSRSPAVAC